MKYNVNEKTLAVIPIGAKKSKILERSRHYEIEESSANIIEESCEYFGVSYKSRQKTTMNILDIKYKSPIIIEEYHRIIFFPLSSPTRSNTVWVSYNNIVSYEKSKRRNHTTVRFTNGQKMDLAISYYSFDQQYIRATKLNGILMNRILRK